MSVQNRLCHLTVWFGSLALCSLTLSLSCLIQRNQGHGTCVTHTLHTADIRAGLVSFTTFCHYLRCLYENFSTGTTPQKTAGRVGLEDQLQCSTQAGFMIREGKNLRATWGCPAEYLSFHRPSASRETTAQKTHHCYMIHIAEQKTHKTNVLWEYKSNGNILKQKRRHTQSNRCRRLLK